MKYIPFLMILILCGCKEENSVQSVSTSSPTPNMLLSDVLEVDYTVMMDTSGTDTWQKNFSAVDFLSDFRERVHAGEVKVYSPFYTDTAGALVPVSIVEMDLGKFSEQNGYKWGKYNTYKLGFTEQWHFDTLSLQFQKSVRWWYPVFYSSEDSADHRLFKVFNSEADELLSANMIFEITFSDPGFDFRYLNHQRLYQWLTSAALNGKIQVYAPDDSVNALKPAVIKERLGEMPVKVAAEGENGEVVYRDEIQKYDITELRGIVFMEDWYYNKSTGSLRKQVNGFAPVRYYENESGNILKSIPFVIFTGTKKSNIL